DVGGDAGAEPDAPVRPQPRLETFAFEPPAPGPRAEVALDRRELLDRVRGEGYRLVPVGGRPGDAVGVVPPGAGPADRGDGDRLRAKARCVALLPDRGREARRVDGRNSLLRRAEGLEVERGGRGAPGAV